MNKLPALLAAIFAFFLLSWLGLVAIPYVQLGRLQPQIDQDTGDVYPISAGGGAAQGRAVYVANGCINCHSQQIRPGHSGTDILRKWGARPTVARDFLYDDPLLAGWTRIGPDLANVGRRRDDPKWHYKHLYDPRSVSPDSIMPRFSFLFETRRITGQPSADALELTGDDAPPKGLEVVPTGEARALVRYLLSLDRTYALPEAPTEAEPEAAPEGSAAFIAPESSAIARHRAK